MGNTLGCGAFGCGGVDELEYGRNGEPTPEIKLCVAGDSQVGKTSFIRHFVQGGESFSREYSPTISLDPYKKRVTLTGELVDLTVWDISGFSGPNRGQQNPNDLMTVHPPQNTKHIPPKLWRLHDRAGSVEARAFTSSALGAIVIFDASRGEEGFVMALAWKLWFEQASTNEGSYHVPIPITLVGNKADLCEEGSLDTEAIETFACDNGFASWMMVSAATGHNVNACFELLASRALAMTYDYHLERGCGVYFEGFKGRNAPPPPTFTPLLRANLNSDAFSGAIQSGPSSHAVAASATEDRSETGRDSAEDGDAQWRVSQLDKSALSAAAEDSPPMMDDDTRATLASVDAPIPMNTQPSDVDEGTTEPLPTSSTTRADDAAVDMPPMPSEAAATSHPPRPPSQLEKEEGAVTSDRSSNPLLDQPGPVPTAADQLTNANGDSPLDARNSRRRQQMLEKQQRHEGPPRTPSPPSPTGSEAAEEEEVGGEEPSMSIAAVAGVETIPTTDVLEEPEELQKTEGGENNENNEEVPVTATDPDPTSAPTSLACDSFSSEDAEGTNAGGEEKTKREEADGLDGPGGVGGAGGAVGAGGVGGGQKGKGKRRRKKKGKGNSKSS
mmetsp:Transcript_70737/g.197816  ORF Transcript_70737/g.197816 Transcript_70737/m.197816 type:complete len:614 (-) Transcript_70737:1367-3208(-)